MPCLFLVLDFVLWLREGPRTLRRIHEFSNQEHGGEIAETGFWSFKGEVERETHGKTAGCGEGNISLGCFYGGSVPMTWAGPEDIQ